MIGRDDISLRRCPSHGAIRQWSPTTRHTGSSSSDTPSRCASACYSAIQSTHLPNTTFDKTPINALSLIFFTLSSSSTIHSDLSTCPRMCLFRSNSSSPGMQSIIYASPSPSMPTDWMMAMSSLLFPVCSIMRCSSRTLHFTETTCIS